MSRLHETNLIAVKLHFKAIQIDPLARLTRVQVMVKISSFETEGMEFPLWQHKGAIRELTGDDI